MKKKKVACLFGCSMLCALALPASTRAQTVLASVTGLVLDPNAAAIVEATVTAKNVDTGIETIVQTNSEGLYHFSNLEPGNYEFSVSKRGFKVITKPGVTIHVMDTVSMNFSMQVGDIRETVTVEAGAPMINTTNASVSTVVDQTYVKNMPLNGRSFQDLILLTPGIVTTTPQHSSVSGQSGEFSVNGQRTEENYYTVDGVSVNVGSTQGGFMVAGAGPSGSVAASTGLGTTHALVSVDDLQEFRVQSSTYSAEYGRNPGGQFAFATKSGTDQWHGAAFDYLRNNYFDANNWFNNYFAMPEPALRQNDFGGTLGGQVRIPGLYNGKDRTFFFVSYEGLRLTAPQPASSSDVPDAALRASAPAPLNQVLDAWPVQSPNGIDDTTNGIAQFIGSWSNPSSLDSTSIRFDHVVSDKLRLFFRFSDSSSSSIRRGGTAIPPSVSNLSDFSMRTYTAGWNSILHNRISNELRLNYSSNETAAGCNVDAFGGSTPVDLRRLTGLDNSSAPGVGLFIGPHSTFIAQQDLQELSGEVRQWNVVDTMSVSLGRHQFKFGVDYRRLASSAVQPAYTPFYLYLSSNAVTSNSGLISPTANAPGYPLYKNFSAFAQDEWRVSSRLSLSLGLRWEVNPPPGVTQGLNPYSVQGSGPDTWTLTQQGTPLWKTTWYNFAPRLGAAYILRSTPGRETVARAGGGVFFDTGQQLGSVGFNGPGFFASGNPTPISFPGNPAALIPAIVNPPVGPQFLAYGFAPHLQLPYTLQWNAAIEQALGKSQALTVSYVGSHASRLIQENDVSSSVNTNLPSVVFVSNGLTSDYDSLQLQFRRRLSRGFTALASYTLSHCIGYGSYNFANGYQRGNCDFDVRHNGSAAFSYDLPNIQQRGLMNAVVDHWGLDTRFIARTAFPVDLTGNPIFDPAGRQTSTGMDLVSGQPVYLYGSNCRSVLQGLGDLKPGQGCPGGRAINPCAFFAVGGPANSGCPTNPAIVGLSPRNFARGFGAVQVNLAVRREFPVYENLKLQFRAEAFNLFNHPNFGTISGSGSNFGQATATLANSLGTLSPLYQMGGPRSMQFALRLTF